MRGLKWYATVILIPPRIPVRLSKFFIHLWLFEFLNPYAGLLIQFVHKMIYQIILIILVPGNLTPPRETQSIFSHLEFSKNFFLKVELKYVLLFLSSTLVLHSGMTQTQFSLSLIFICVFIPSFMHACIHLFQQTLINYSPRT